jgi:hypothetical protein
MGFSTPPRSPAVAELVDLQRLALSLAVRAYTPNGERVPGNAILSLTQWRHGAGDYSYIATRLPPPPPRKATPSVPRPDQSTSATF